MWFWGLSHSVQLKSSKKMVDIYGKGAPVVFCSGLFGTMPHQMYSNFLSNIRSNMSVCIVRGAAPLTAPILEDIADTISVSKVGLISHSALDLSLLESERMLRAVLFDPISFPTVSPLSLLKPARAHVSPACETLLCYAGQTFNAAPAVPNMFRPQFWGDNVIEVHDSTSGHVDILDDRWANFATGIGLFAAARAQPLEFSDWTPRDTRTTRAEYRNVLAERAAAFVLDETSYSERRMLCR